MKRKHIVFVIVLLLLTQQAWAQSSFGNLTKYGWYRYRLVNDFMKIGEGCCVMRQLKTDNN
ncbi:MAG: hypothetical protein JSS64_02065 [Bacteroidetes bacterium]|nr:hypothetical protein [Bacteroidota bacterium]